MHDLGCTDCTQASLCGCTRPERANRFMLHIAVYVVHCQLPGTKASHCAAYSASQEARGDIDACSSRYRLHTGIVVWVH